MCEYTDECVCHQVASPSRPLSTAISQSPDACSPGEMLLSCWGRLAVFFPSCSQCGRIRTPEPGQSYPGEETCPPPSCPWLNLGLAFLQQPCPTSPAKVQGSLELGLETSCEAESWDVRHGCCQAEHGLWHVQVLNSFSIPSRTRR